jgi:hypothetical protein
MEPLSGQLIIAKSAFQAGTAAIQLSNTVIGRLKVRRMVAAAEEQAIRYWLQEQLAEFKIASDMVLDRRVQDAIATVWEKLLRSNCAGAWR